MRKLTAVLLSLLVVNCFASKLWTCPKITPNLLKQVKKRQQGNWQGWRYDFVGKPKLAKLQSKGVQFQQAQMGEVKLNKRLTKPGILCVYQLPNQPAVFRLFHYGYFYTVPGKQYDWQELGDKRSKLCQKPAKAKQYSSKNCQFKQILNWP